MKIRVLQVVFRSDIEAFEIPAFRGAVIQKAGQENSIFHNHGEDDAFIYRYPLIQYKRVGRNPCIFCIGDGADEVQHFFSNSRWEDMCISGRMIDTKIDRLNLNQFNVQIWNHTFDYRINNWIALSQKNIGAYQELTTDEHRKEFLERIMKGNILSFAKGIGWTVEKQIEVSIYGDIKERIAKIKGKSLVGIDCSFRSNVFIPNYVGLGKSVSIGYGVVRMKHSDNKGDEIKE